MSPTNLASIENFLLSKAFDEDKILNKLYTINILTNLGDDLTLIHLRLNQIELFLDPKFGKVKLTFASNRKYMGFRYLVSMKMNKNVELFSSIRVFEIFDLKFDER